MTGKANPYYRNIKIDYIYTFVKNINLTNGFWLIYLASKGLSLAWLGILEGIFHVTSLLMETPTGAIADIFGRKFSRLLGLFFNVAYLSMILLGSETWHYAIAFILCALSYNLESGAGEALVYDSLKYNGREGEFVRIGGVKEVFYQMACAVGLIFGGYIAVYNYDAPFIIMIFLYIAALGVGLFFKEVPIEKTTESIHIWAAIKNQYSVSFRFIREERRIMYIAVLLNIVGTFVLIAFFYAQNYWINFGVSESAIGLLLAAHSLMAAAGGYFAHKIEKKLGEKKLILIGFIILTLMYWFLYVEVISFVVVVLIGFVDSLIYVVLSAYLNHMIPSEQRATLLSFSSMIFSMIMIIAFPLVGYMGDQLGLNITFAILAGTLTLMTFYLIYKLNKSVEK